MKTTQHTPGPWEIFPSATKQEITVGNYGVHAPLVLASAVVPGLDYQAWANARLIAAAPELLEALEACELAFNAIGSDLPAWAIKTWRNTEAAIAKAKGEAQ